MAIFADLSDDSDVPDASPEPVHLDRLQHSHNDDGSSNAFALAEPDRNNPNINGFSEALACYPFVSQLATFVDLNTLDALSRTCRQFRANLLQFRPQLMALSLRCSNEEESVGSRLTERLVQSRNAWFGRAVEYSNRVDAAQTRLTTGKVGKCAIDQVGECRRCGIIVCRNCTTKPPLSKSLPERHRRLCKQCIKVPLERHMTLGRPWQTAEGLADMFARHLDANESRSASSSPPSSIRTRSASSTPSTSPPNLHALDPTSRPATVPPLEKNSPSPPVPHIFTNAAFLRTPCACEDAVFLCNPCGAALRQSDSTYIRAWKWRTHYTASLGGLGTGIGEGHEGVECGRGGDCLGARLVAKEDEFFTEEEAAEEAGMVTGDTLGFADAMDGEAGTPRSWEGTSYYTGEVEGVGGTVKKKVKKLVRVGLVVREHEVAREYEYEMGHGDHKRKGLLPEERSGESRSWCGWCDRVILGRKDRAEWPELTTDAIMS